MIHNGILALILALSIICAQEPTASNLNPGGEGVYVIAFRTPAHVRSSSPEIFHTAAADLRKILSDGKVMIVEDKERGFIENESQMSVESMAKLAAEAGAGSLLFVTVDRPATKWIKLVLRLYALNGKLLWEDSVDSGMSAMSGGAGYKKCFEKLNKLLAARIGGPGLPVHSR